MGKEEKTDQRSRRKGETEERKRRIKYAGRKKEKQINGKTANGYRKGCSDCIGTHRAKQDNHTRKSCTDGLF